MEGTHASAFCTVTEGRLPADSHITSKATDQRESTEYSTGRPRCAAQKKFARVSVPTAPVRAQIDKRVRKVGPWSSRSHLAVIRDQI